MSRRKPESLKYHRKAEPTKIRTTIYIYCNGITEKLYFDGLKYFLRLPAHVVEISEHGDNRLSLVEKVEQLLKPEGIKPVEGERQIWVVFDLDSLPKGECPTDPKVIENQADEAVDLCRRLKYKWAVSNECFELWLLLHFDYCSSHLHRDVLLKKIKQKIPGFEKTNYKYEDYLQGEPTQKAIRNASKLCAEHGDFPKRVSQCRPFTNAHKLVEEMIALSRTLGSQP